MKTLSELQKETNVKVATDAKQIAEMTKNKRGVSSGLPTSDFLPFPIFASKPYEINGQKGQYLTILVAYINRDNEIDFNFVSLNSFAKVYRLTEEETQTAVSEQDNKFVLPFDGAEMAFSLDGVSIYKDIRNYLNGAIIKSGEVIEGHYMFFKTEIDEITQKEKPVLAWDDAPKAKVRTFERAEDEEQRTKFIDAFKIFANDANLLDVVKFADEQLFNEIADAKETDKAPKAPKAKKDKE